MTKISVVIPAYNCAATIRPTLDSVLRQSIAPDEILVVDDGSTDDTAAILNEYRPRVRVFHQENGGVASALNVLCSQAHGDLIAVLGSDDIWHTRYLEAQRKIFHDYPKGVAYFTGHVNFSGDGDYNWNVDPFETQAAVEVIPPLEFLRRYNKTPGPFMCMSHCCVPKQMLARLGDEPFKLRMAEDLYFFNRLAPSGPIVFLPKPLTAYRVRKGSLSSDRLKLTAFEVRAFELLEGYYGRLSDVNLVRTFGQSFAAKRRLYAKVLLGAGMTSEARAQLWRSLHNTYSPVSAAKSVGMFLLSFMPQQMQPTWPSSHRVWKDSETS